jgi:hypothetical protein
MKNKLVIASAIVSVSLAAVYEVSAGGSYSYPVSISASNATGSMGAVRNSADNIQQIGCYVYSYDPPLAYCIARDANNVWASCTSSTQRFVDNARALGPDSWLSFSWSGGSCTALQIGHHSWTEPKR